ncbi:MAG: response regulator [Cytophagales bacterium]|nr:response regulator [Cytophagales bacterium]
MILRSMSREYIIFVLCAVSIIAAGHGYAQPSKFHGHFDIYSTKNGLSQNDIRTIFQDSFGFIWIGTHGGLNRFDGYSFKTYLKDVNDENAISSNLIGSIQEDVYGNLWIGTDDEGVVIMERATNNFISIKNSKKNPQQLTNNHVLSILIDKDNTVWVGTIDGLNKITYDSTSKTPSVEKLLASNDDPYSISHNNISCIFEDKLGNLWFGTANGLNRYINTGGDGNHQFIYYENGPSVKIRSIASNDTSLMIASANEISTLSFLEINRNSPRFTVLRNSSYNKIIIDSKENIWAASLNGLDVSYHDQGSIVTHTFINNWADPHSLSQNIVSTIMEDRSGILWIGTNGGGINLYNPNRKSFHHHKRNKNPGSLSYNKIRSIFEDPEKNLWIGTEGGGLNLLLHPNTSYDSGFIHFDLNQVPGGENFVFSFAAVFSKESKRMYVGTGYSSNLEVIDITDPNNIHKMEYTGLNTDAPVFSLLYDSDSILWVGTYQNGLFRMQFDRGGQLVKSTHFAHRHQQGDISSDVVRYIEEDQQGNLWIGTDEGINKLTPAEKVKEVPNFIKYKHDPEDSSSISYDYVMPIFESSNGILWVGTLGGGLNKMARGTAPDNDRFEWITTEDGLPDNVIKSIEEDAMGNLWISSNNGLSRYNPNTLEFVNYGISDGLQDTEFSELASYSRSNGEMIFGGVNGFNIFVPEEIKTDTLPASVVFTDLQILNRSVATGKVLNGRVILKDNLNKIKKLDLKHNENSFSLEFAALHYASPGKNKYAYLLEGFDEEWVFTSSQNRIARYTNLSPGHYTLHVKASNSDGIWNNSPLSLDIHINQPVWFTYPALALYGLLAVIGLWFFRKYTLITNIRKNQLLIEHLEKEKTEEVSQLKLRFFTNVSHEFRTPLTLILGLVERLRNPVHATTPAERNQYYDKIHRNSQVLLNLVNQLLDFRKVEQGKHKIRVVEGDIGQYIQNLCDNFNELARKKKIDYTFICEDKIEGWYDHDIVERVMFNLLSNAFKFTNEEGEITVSLEKDKDTSLLRLEVSDTGIGMSKNVQDHLFERFSDAYVKREHGSGIGLSYTKGLIELYYGSITFRSKANIGTTFSLTFPYQKEAFANDEIVDEKEELPGIGKDVNWVLEAENGELDPLEKSPGKKEHTILLVEDNRDILFYLHEHFKKSYNIAIAYEGQEALETCLKSNIDLVISDVMMPGMDGLTFCEKLKQDDRINHIPVILLTAKKSLDNKVTGYEKGADAYISKPFNMQELETRMEGLIVSRKKLLSKIRKNIDISPSEVEVTSLDEKFLKRVMTYIEENIGITEFTVEMLARECGMSQLHLNKKLKIIVGQTANAFIRTIRLKRAAQLLAKNRYSVNEVMYEVGFIDAKYFRTCFKKEFGMTPSDYQREQGEKAF